MLRTTLFLIACALLASVQALATDAAPRPYLGAGIWSRPAYAGSDANVVAPFPIVRYYGKHWFARTTQEVVEGGIRAEVFNGFSVGAQLAYEGGRATRESDFLTNHNVETLHLISIPSGCSKAVWKEGKCRATPATAHWCRFAAISMSARDLPISSNVAA